MSKALQIKDFPEYYVTDTGDVYSRKTYRNNPSCRIKKLSKEKTKHGYYRVRICKNDGIYHKAVHRLVAETFIPNPENKPEINHIDGNPSNNNINNLEWVTRSENELHKYRTLNRKSPMFEKTGNENPLSKPVLQLKDGKVIAEFCAVMDAVRATGIGHIDAVCRGIRKSAGGYQWKYA